jgi:hypothetical protein
MKSVVDLTQKIKDFFQPQVDSLKETLTNQINMNWSEGSKNYIPFPYAIASVATGYNVSDLGDGGITISGTSTLSGSLLIQRFKLPVGTYKFTCAKNSDAPIGENTSSAHYYMLIYGINGSSTWVRSDQDITTRTFTVTDASKEILLSIYVANGDTAPLTSFYPMIRRASITDPTYQPYAKTNQELTQETTGLISNDFTNGAVNLLENTASSQVLSGVTFVVNDDGTVTANATGTVSSIYFPLHTYSNDEYQKLFAGKTLKILGTPTGAASGIRIFAELNGTNVIDETNAPIATLPTTSGTFIVYIRIPANSPVSNLIFKPMITVADMPNSDYNHYVPYAMSNKELTHEMSLFSNAIDREITTSTAWSDLENMGTYVMNGVPFSGNWSIVLVLKRNQNTGVQIAFRVGASSDVSSSYVAYRMYYSGTWSNWSTVNATNMP